MMPLKAFFILSVLLCGLIIQPSMAVRDLAHDTQTKVVAHKSVDAAALKGKDATVGYKPLKPSRPATGGKPYTPGCRFYRCSPPSSP